MAPAPWKALLNPESSSWAWFWFACTRPRDEIERLEFKSIREREPCSTQHEKGETAHAIEKNFRDDMHFQFLSLPLEIRMLICRWLWADSPITIRASDKGSRCCTPIPTTIFTVSKQISAEAIQVFMQDKVALLTWRFYNFRITPRMKSTLRSLKHLGLKLHFDRNPYCTMRWRAENRRLKALFKRVGDAILDRGNDACVPDVRVHLEIKGNLYACLFYTLLYQKAVDTFAHRVRRRFHDAQVTCIMPRGFDHIDYIQVGHVLYFKNREKKEMGKVGRDFWWEAAAEFVEYQEWQTPEDFVAKAGAKSVRRRGALINL